MDKLCNFKEIQEDEIDVISATYRDDFVQEDDSYYQITLLPHWDDPANCFNSATLSFRFPPTYPNVVPEWDISTNNISDNEIADLKILIANQLEDSLGEPMIYDLTMEITHWLQAHNKKKISYYEMHIEQVKKEKEVADKKLREEQERKEAQTAEITQQILQDEWKRKGMISKRKRNWDENTTTSSSTPTPSVPSTPSTPPLSSRSPGSPFSTSSPSESLRAPKRYDSKKRARWERTTQLGSGSCGTLWNGIYKDTGKLVAIREIQISPQLPAAKKSKFVKLLLEKIESAKNLQNKHLVAFQTCIHDEQTDMIYIFSELCSGSIKIFLKQLQKFEEALVQSYLKQILRALNFLHSQGFAHADLKMSHILVDNDSNIKLSDFIIRPVLKPLVSGKGEIDESINKKQDLFQLGILASEMVGRPISSFAEVEHLPVGLSPEFKSFVGACFKSASDKKIDVQFLLSHVFISDLPTQSEAVPYTPPSSLGAEDESDELEDISLTISGPRKLNFNSENKTRYQNDFDELEKVGEGGFGSVVKARNRLDGRIYAIKKIKFGRTDVKFMDRVLREVMTLSRLHHQHVVRYYQAWLDREEDDKDDSGDIDDDEFGSSDSITQSNSGEDWFGITPSLSLRNSMTASDISKKKNQSFRYDFGSENPSFDSDDDFSTEETSVVPSPKPKGVKSPEIKQILYIQMEYCTAKTLRNIIDEGIDDEEEILRLFRQITEGMKHIHSQGMIHRDLKPANIFIDRNGDVAIGDFGLATTGVSKAKQTFKDILRQTEDKILFRSGDLTTGVGTAMYLAPEQGKKGAQYDQKVDIYSLGIIFFELCYPFSTQLERSKVLKEVRLPVPLFPEGFTEAHPQNAEVIGLMLQQNPELRPTAQQLLQFLPPKLEEEMLKEVIRSVVTAPDSTIYQHLMEKLFHMSNAAVHDASFDIHHLIQTQDNAIQYQVTKQIISVFKRHGAALFDCPLLFPKSPLNPHAVCMLDEAGTLVQLPYDLTLPFARQIAHKQIQSLRRYTLGRVFRKSPHGGQPEALTEIDFDIVAPASNTSGHVYIAEIMKCMVEAMDTFEEKLGAYYIRINNYVMLEALIRDCCEEPEAIQTLIVDTIGKVWRTGWEEVEKKLVKISGIRPNTVNIIGEVVKATFASSNTVAILKKLESQFRDKSKAFADGIKEVNAVLQSAKLFGIFQKIKFDITLVHNFRYYEDFVFQVVLKKGGREGLIAAGGKYSSLVQQYSLGTGAILPKGDVFNQKKFQAQGIVNHAPVAAGVSFAVDRLVALVRQHEEAHRNPDIKTQFETETEVLLVSEEKTMLKERITLANRLWERGIKAEYTYDGNDMSIDAITDFCIFQGIPVLVVFKERLFQRDQSLRVKTVYGKIEATMNEQELIALLMQRRNNIADGRQESHTVLVKEKAPESLCENNPKKDKSLPPSQGPAVKASVDVEFLVPTPSKQKRRTLMSLEKAIEKNVAMLGKLATIKTYVVELPFPLLKEIATTWDPQTSSILSLTGARARWKPQVADLKTALMENKNVLPFVLVYSNIDNQFLYIQTTK